MLGFAATQRMDDLSTLRIQNYRECLVQSQRYLVLALGTAVAAWVLRAGTSRTEDLVALPGMFVRVDAPTARLAFVALNFLSAALATYTVETAQRLANSLNVDAPVASIVYEYPSIVTSPYPAVRLGGPLLGAGLVLWTQLSWAWPLKEWNGAVWAAIIVPLVPYATLVMGLWTHPSGKLNPLASTSK